MEQELRVFADKYSVSRIKFSTIHFDLDYQRDGDGSLHLKTEKAVIRTHGKVTKVPIGADQEHKTFEEAFEATKKYWQEYYREVRAERSEEEKRAEALRQKRYRDKKRGERQEFRERQ